MYIYQENNEYFAQVQAGVEEIAATELTQLGATSVRAAFRGVGFTADAETLYKINYCSRLIMRVLAPLLTFDCHSEKYLYRRACEVDWPELFDLDTTFAVSANVSNSHIRNSRFASLRLKDAIADTFRERMGQRPDVDTHSPDLRVHLHIQGNHATISLDTSGESLHKRGYRMHSVEAPMQETLAAAIINISGWDGTQPLTDPMCGSGTLLAEAWMKAANIPAGYLRQKFGFFQLPDFDQAIWRRIKTEADAAIALPAPGLISGSDIDRRAVSATERNLSMLPGGANIALKTQDYQDIASLNKQLIVCNPPYGVRLQKGERLDIFMKEFGDFLKQRCSESVAYIYFGERELIKRIGLRPSGKWPLTNGGLDGRLARYEMY